MYLKFWLGRPPKMHFSLHSNDRECDRSISVSFSLIRKQKKQRCYDIPALEKLPGVGVDRTLCINA